MFSSDSAGLRTSQDSSLRSEWTNGGRKAAERKRDRFARNAQAAYGGFAAVSLDSVRLKSSQDSSLALGMTGRPTGVLRRVSLVSVRLKSSQDSSLRSE